MLETFLGPALESALTFAAVASVHIDTELYVVVIVGSGLLKLNGSLHAEKPAT